jgi:hypothetical protein
MNGADRFGEATALDHFAPFDEPTHPDSTTASMRTWFRPVPPGGKRSFRTNAFGCPPGSLPIGERMLRIIESRDT